MSTWMEGVIDWFEGVTDPYQDLPSEEACRAFLASLRWRSGFRCPHCEGVEGTPLPNHGYRCRRCDRRTSLTAGTLLHRTKLPLRIWLAAIWYATRSENGIAALRFQNRFGLASYAPVWRMFHAIRDAFPGDRRQNLCAARSSATVQILGRHRPRVAASVDLDVTAARLVARTHATATTRGDGTARMLLETLRAAVIGTHHGVSSRHLQRYVRELLGRWRDRHVFLDVLAAALNPA